MEISVRRPGLFIVDLDGAMIGQNCLLMLTLAADAFPAGPTIWKAEARATPGGEDRSARVTYR